MIDLRQTRIPKSYAVTLIVAVGVRLFFIQEVLASPLRYYHTLRGLDMYTFFDRADQLTNPMYWASIYNVLLGLFKFINPEYAVPMMLILQSILGIATALLAVYCTRRLVRDNVSPMIAGILAAGYAPGLLYEAVLLRETMQVFLSFAAFAGLLAARKRHFMNHWAVFAGFCLALPAFIRITGMLFALLGGLWMVGYIWRRTHDLRRTLRTLLLGAAGGAILLGTLTVWNGVLRHEYLPFAVSLRYSISVGGESVTAGTYPGPGGEYAQKSGGCLQRFGTAE